jgi:hypothetical protein
MRVSVFGVNARLVFVALAASLAATTAAAAADAPAVMAKWGLLGTWASNCAGPPSRAVPFYNWVQRGGDAFLDRDYGEGKDSNRVLAASARPNGLIELQVEFKAFSQIRVNAYIKGDDGRIRMYTNHDMHGGYSVKDGKLVDNGVATNWDTRCR